MEASDFYLLRDDRTNACVERASYADRAVAISIDRAAAESYSGQVAFVLATNLTARWCRRMRLAAPNVAVDPRLAYILDAASADLGGLALAVARAADPFADFATSSGDLHDAIRLHVGAGDAPSGAYRIQGQGWLALAGDAARSDATDSGGAPLGAILAACVGAAWAFRVAIHDSSLPDDVRLSLWNLRGGEAATDHDHRGVADLGHVALIGCGAVGSSMAYLLPLVGIRAGVHLVDGDLVDVTNLNRSPVFLAADVGSAKCDVVASYLRRAGLEATSLRMWFDDAIASGLLFRDRPDIVVPAANDRGVRYAIQHQVPPLQVYGTTGRDWQAFLGRHIPGIEDCLACRFPVRGPATPPLACATASISASRDEPLRDAALPFLSTAAAALAVAELVKATTRSFPTNSNFSCLDFRGPLSDFASVQMPASSTCFCISQRQVSRRLNGMTAFAHLE